MRIRPSRRLLSLAALAGAVFVVCGGQAAERNVTGTSANRSAKVESSTGPATLRSLNVALATQDREQAAKLTWRLLAAMARAKEQGAGPSEYLAAGYRAEKLGVAESAPVQQCLLGAWASAQSMWLFTPENLARMDRGESPRVTRGLQRDIPVIFDTGAPPEMTMKMKIDFAAARATAPNAQPRITAVPMVPSATPPPPVYQVKTYDARLNEKLPLDSCGLTNWDLRLDRVDRIAGVSFTLENRLANPNKTADRSRAFAVNFIPEPIPGTTLQGVKLKDDKFASIYLDENLGAQVSYRIVVRGPREIFMLDQLSPELRKYYGGYSPP